MERDGKLSFQSETQQIYLLYITKWLIFEGIICIHSILLSLSGALHPVAAGKWDDTWAPARRSRGRDQPPSGGNPFQMQRSILSVTTQNSWPYDHVKYDVPACYAWFQSEPTDSGNTVPKSYFNHKTFYTFDPYFGDLVNFFSSSSLVIVRSYSQS